MKTLTDDRELVTAYLHHDGCLNNALTSEEKNALYDMADGFDTTPEYWDWSHIREASDEAIDRMARAIRVLRAGK